VAALIAALSLPGCGGDGEAAPSGGAGGSEAGAAASGGGAGAPTGGRQTETTPAGPDERRRIDAAVHSYVAAIDADDGAALCALLAPRALAGVDLPVRRATCAGSLSASIGHPTPAGSPRWLRTRLVDADTVVTITGAIGRLTGTVVHRFAGGREPSIEDDVIYLRRVGGRWLIAKPSATFYRAIGVRDVPIEALRPP
jgi:hypothetical protein